MAYAVSPLGVKAKPKADGMSHFCKERSADTLMFLSAASVRAKARVKKRKSHGG